MTFEITTHAEDHRNSRILAAEVTSGGRGSFGLIKKHRVPGLERTMYFMPLFVESPRRRGVGTELVAAAARMAIEEGAEELRGDVESPYMLHILHKLFGTEAVTYADWDPINKQRVELPMTHEQALMSLARARLSNSDISDRDAGIVAIVDVRGAFKSEHF